MDQVTKDYQQRDPEDALEDALDDAWRIWPYIARQATTWAAVAGLIASIGMNAKFSQIIGVEVAIGIIIWAMFSMFDVAVPFVTVATDSNPDGKDTEPRPWYFYFVLAVSVSTSLLVGWTSLGSIGTRANVKSEVHNARVLVLQNEIKRTSSIIDKSKASETSESYTHKAEALDRNALTEKRNKFCGRKCRGWKFKAEEMRGLAASAKAKEDAMAAREAAQIELDSKTDEAVLTNGIGIMAAKLGYKDHKFILLSGLMLMITALITVMPFLWVFAFDGAQRSRSLVMQRVKRKVYRKAIAMPGGNVWLSQKFSPDELVIMATDPATQEAMNAQAN
ncbi:MAG: hypothetical protein GY938_07900, partial [Ketobacter sp.]|nr:hypothetical protein [Ketobacter sp.]